MQRGIASTASHGVESFPFGSECIKNYIRKPDVMQKELWGDNAYVNLWNADSDAYGNNNTYNDTPVIKTVYDPCPAGFSLPPSNAFTGFTTTGKNVTNNAAEYNGEWDSSQLGWNFYCGPNKTGGTIFFPITGGAAGIRRKRIGNRYVGAYLVGSLCRLQIFPQSYSPYQLSGIAVG